MAQFTDKTGRSGPAAWELGHYPEGQDDHPAGGISWYEASAFAEYAGETLPMETTARPFMDLLGTPAQHKKLILVEGGHVPPVDSNLAREMSHWLDKFLGPVTR